jgi:NAD(P) transhydrogenase subunit alpha
MKIAVLKERYPGENRVAISPDTTRKLTELDIKVYIEKGAGEASNIQDEDYIKAGAIISKVPLEIIADAQVILKVQPSFSIPNDELSELSLAAPSSILIGMLSPYDNKSLIKHIAQKNISSFALEFMPRITRAQNMDVLSSQANLAGYKAVLEAANEFGRIFPMMMTAAGTLTPAKVLVLGAGVAGLQAIATAKRLGAVVSAFDVRPAVKEQVESLGGKFIEVSADSSSLETSGGYAREMTEEYKKLQQELIADSTKKHDIIICTALIPGKKSPILVTEEMVHSMKTGSVIVDLATTHGGNCALSVKDQVVTTTNKVKIIGYSNMSSRIAQDSSKLFASNIFNFLMLLYNREERRLNINLDDEIVRNTLITHHGEIVNNNLKEVYSHE